MVRLENILKYKCLNRRFRNNVYATLAIIPRTKEINKCGSPPGGKDG